MAQGRRVAPRGEPVAGAEPASGAEPNECGVRLAAMMLPAKSTTSTTNTVHIAADRATCCEWLLMFERRHRWCSCDKHHLWRRDVNDNDNDNDNGGDGDRRRDDEIRDTKAEDENEYKDGAKSKTKDKQDER